MRPCSLSEICQLPNSFGRRLLDLPLSSSWRICDRLSDGEADTCTHTGACTHHARATCISRCSPSNTCTRGRSTWPSGNSVYISHLLSRHWNQPVLDLSSSMTVPVPCSHAPPCQSSWPQQQHPRPRSEELPVPRTDQVQQYALAVVGGAAPQRHGRPC